MHFNVSVEPIPHYLDRVAAETDKRAHRDAKRHFGLVVQHLQKLWPSKSDVVRQRLLEGPGDMVGNIQIDRAEMLGDLRRYAVAIDRGLTEGPEGPTDPPRFAHLRALPDADGLVIPIKFAHPIMFDIAGRAQPVPICSIFNLRDELNQLNKHLHVERTFALHRMPAYVLVDDREIEGFEAAYDYGESFWVKVGFCALRVLNDKAIEHKMPVIFHFEG